MINSNGEFSMLIKKPGFKALDEKQLNYYELEHFRYVYPEFIEDLKKGLPHEFSECKTILQIKGNANKLRDTGNFPPEYIEKLENTLGEILPEKFAKYQSKPIDFDVIKRIHKFWQDYADELGVVYRTNYSYLGA